MIHRWYERSLKRRQRVLPAHICFMIAHQDMTDTSRKICEVTSWCNEMEIGEVTFHISTDETDVYESFLPAIRRIGEIAHLTLHHGNKEEVIGEGMSVTVAIGQSGQAEICEAIRKMAEDGVEPENVDEQTIESYLTFQCEPDLLIKTGGNHLVDFLIWQSVYSEIFFSDVNWAFFRKVDFLRALRDYQFRKRRFGT
jgi:undecaprenyl diphosphate synthase